MTIDDGFSLFMLVFGWAALLAGAAAVASCCPVIRAPGRQALAGLWVGSGIMAVVSLASAMLLLPFMKA